MNKPEKIILVEMLFRQCVELASTWVLFALPTDVVREADSADACWRDVSHLTEKAMALFKFDENEEAFAKIPLLQVRELKRFKDAGMPLAQAWAWELTSERIDWAFPAHKALIEGAFGVDEDS